MIPLSNLDIDQFKHALVEEGLDAGDLDADAVESLIKNPILEPIFPMVVLVFAFLKDIIDAGGATVILIPLTTTTSIAISASLIAWVLGKANVGGGGAWWKKFLLRKILQRMGFVIVLEMIPGLQIIPATTLFVFWVYSNEKNMHDAVKGAMEKMKHLLPQF